MVVILYSLLELLSIIVCLFYLYDKKFRLNIKTVMFLIMGVIAISLIELNHLQSAYTMLLYILLIIYTGMEFGFHYKAMLVNILLTLIIISVLQLCGILLFHIIFLNNVMSEQNYMILNALICCTVLLGFERMKIYRISQILQEKDIVVFLSSILVFVVVGVYIIRFKILTLIDIRIYLVLFVMALYIFFLTAVFLRYKKAVIEKEAELHLQKVYAESYQNMIVRIQTKQHEFDNHINTIMSQHYMYRDYESLVEIQSKYIKDLSSDNKFNKMLTRGNPLVIGFLYSKFILFDQNGIDVTYKLDFEELDCRIPLFRLVEILGNFLDNAADATKNCTLKKIHVTILEQEDISIEVRNLSDWIPVQEVSQFFRKGYSSKGDNRGIGLYHVSEICREYDIELSCANQNIQNDNWLSFFLKIR